MQDAWKIDVYRTETEKAENKIAIRHQRRAAAFPEKDFTITWQLTFVLCGISGELQSTDLRILEIKMQPATEITLQQEVFATASLVNTQVAPDQCQNSELTVSVPWVSTMCVRWCCCCSSWDQLQDHTFLYGRSWSVRRMLQHCTALLCRTQPCNRPVRGRLQAAERRATHRPVACNMRSSHSAMSRALLAAVRSYS